MRNDEKRTGDPRAAIELQEPTITVSGPVACGKSYVMELIYKALRNAGLHPYSDELAHERRMVEEQPQPAAKVWRLRESVYAAPPQAAPAQEPVAWETQSGYIDRSKQFLLRNGFNEADLTPLYAAPQQDEAVALLREAYNELIVDPEQDEATRAVGDALVERIRAFLKDRT